MDTASTAARPLIVTADEVLTAELMRLCAAASVSPDVIAEPERARRAWAEASCVLVGADRAGAVASLGLDRREGVILVARSPESARVWRSGVEIRADHVVMIPEGESWVVDRLADSAEAGAKTALTVGVVAARGGAGASTLAAAIGLSASRRGESAVLIDVDPRAGGIELVVGCEESEGLRWSEVAKTRGRVSAHALRSALPSVDGLSVLSWSRSDDTPLDPETMRAMVSSAQRGADLVLLDIGRHLDNLTLAAVAVADVLLVVCTLDLRAAAGAARILAVVRPLSPDTRLVCRRRRGARLDPDDLAEMLDLPLAGVVATRRAAEQAVDDGLGPLLQGRMTRECERVLAASRAAVSRSQR